jgi:DNA invertase Pin-like site-specific DNA recombinase
MIVAYLRVSSRSQDVEMQRTAILREAEQRKFTVDEWFVEQASSVGLRPELERLRGLVRGGGVERVVVFKLDRLTRSGMLELLNIVQEFRRKNCAIHSVSDAFSFEGPAADLVLAVLAWAGQMEREFIRNRLEHARISIESRGGHWGRPRRVIDDAKIEQIVAMKRERHMTARKIAMSLGIPRSTVGDVLSGKYPPRRRTGSTEQN